jgi:hypothetical protein
MGRCERGFSLIRVGDRTRVRGPANDPIVAYPTGSAQRSLLSNRIVRTLSVRPLPKKCTKANQKRRLFNRIILITHSLPHPRECFADLSSGANSIALEDVIQPLEPVERAIPGTSGRCLEVPDPRDFRMVRHDDQRAFAPVENSQKSVP